MTWTMEVLADFVSSLGLLAMLAMVYGIMRRKLPGTALAPQVLGVLFGLVAVIQMYSPLSPVDGVIIDMRCIPVALAGAFLGLRGLLICVVIAGAARISIGGIGWMSGVVSIILAGSAGTLWNHLMRGAARRSLLAIFGLAAMMSFHIAAVLFLPHDVAIWFVSVAMPVVLLLNLTALPLVAVLMERERVAMDLEALERGDLGESSSSGFLAPDAFARTLAQMGILPPLDGAVTMVAIEVRRRALLTTFWGAGTEGRVMRELRRRLEEILPHGGQMGLVRGEVILLALPSLGPAALAELTTRIRRDVGGIPIAVPGMASIRPAIALRHARFDAMPTLREAMAGLRIGTARSLSAPVAGPAMRTGGQTPAIGPGTARLFHVADRMFEACEAGTDQRSLPSA